MSRISPTPFEADQLRMHQVLPVAREIVCAHAEKRVTDEATVMAYAGLPIIDAGSGSLTGIEFRDSSLRALATARNLANIAILRVGKDRGGVKGRLSAFELFLREKVFERADTDFGDRTGLLGMLIKTAQGQH